MNYPVWDLPGLGPGLVVAIIAIFHVFVSHFAIGGGAFLWLAEWWASRSPDGARIREFLHRYATFFLVFTTVFGAMTGVGIWFAIQLANPEATSLLIHQFVFAWATEWVVFLAELSLLYLYYYGQERNPPGRQVFLAGAYFVVSWFSLFIINGILSFMLTPGAWTLEHPSIVAGFFNPSFWPSLLIRTLVMFLLGGLGAMVVASRLERQDDLKERVVRFASRFVLPAAILVPFLFAWYWSTLPQGTVTQVVEGVTGLGGGRLDALTRHLVLAGISGTVVVLGVLAAMIRPRALTFAGALSLFLAVQLGLMGAEFFREMARKPWVIHGVLYSNSLWAKDAADPERLSAPFLSRTRWHDPNAVGTPAHGEQVFRFQCAACHTRDGYRSLRQRTASWTPDFGFRWLQTMHQQGVMPPFQGNEEDRAALTAWLLGLRGESLSAQDVLHAAQMAEQARTPVPPTPAQPPTAEPGSLASPDSQETASPEVPR